MEIAHVFHVWSINCVYIYFLYKLKFDSVSLGRQNGTPRNLILCGLARE